MSEVDENVSRETLKKLSVKTEKNYDPCKTEIKTNSPKRILLIAGGSIMNVTCLYVQPVV